MSGKDEQRGEASPPEGSARWSELVEAAEGLSFVVDASGLVRWASRGLLELLGQGVERVVGLSFVELVHPADRDRTRHEAERILAGGEAIRFENRYRCADGSYRWLSWFLLADAGAALTYAFAIDVTDSKRTERVTAEANLAGRIGGWEWDMATGAVYVTEEAHRLLELPAGGFEPAFAKRLLSAADLERFLLLAERAALGRSPSSFECEVCLPSGKRFWANIVARPVLEAEQVARVLGTVQDVTEQRRDRIQAEEARAATERLLANVPGGYAFRCRLDAAFSMEWMSAGAEEVTGYPAAEFLSGATEYRALLTPGEEKLIRATVDEASATGGDFENEHLIRARDGSFRWVLCRGRLLVGSTGAPEGLEGFMLDITERRAIEDSLRAREAELFAASQRMSLLIENVGAAIIEFDVDGRVRYVNGIAARLAGMDPEALVGRELGELATVDVAEEAIGKIRLAVEGGTPTLEERPAEVGGVRRIFQARLYPQIDPTGELATAVLIARDVTEQRRAEAQLLLADRMVSMGTMAAGVAHEINNPLTYILGNISYSVQQLRELREALPAHDATFEDLEVALRDAASGAERVAAIVRDLRLFSRLEDDPPGAVDLGPVLASVVRMLRNEIEHRAILELDVADAPAVAGTDARLGQVFTNLLVNALQALPDRSPNENLIRLSLRTEGPDADRVVVEVSDNGPGIPPESRQRIFDPFFTTKPAGLGTGLGLSICHGIVTSLGGVIEVDDSALGARGGSGATFRVKLPRARGASSSVAHESELPPRLLRDKPRVFLVEDDPSVARSLKRILGRSYDVVVEHDGQSLLARLARGETANALVCDLMMPGMDGPDLFSQIESLAPDLAAHCGFISGGAFTERTIDFVRQLPPDRLLPKPFSSSSLRAFLARLLR